MKSIYLAGKIGKNDWRHELMPQLRGVSGDLADGPGAHALPIWPVLPGAVYGLDYIGPFFMGCDHGCAHGDNTHGNAVEGYGGCTGHANSMVVANNCYMAIRKCDIFFAWLGGADATTAYGTLVEIGYARAIGKEVVIGTDSPDPNLWFAFEPHRPELLDHKSIIVAPTPLDAVRQAFEGFAARRLMRELLESPLEEAFFDAWTGLQPPELDGLVAQHQVVANGKNYRLDFALPERKIAFEMDGRTYHDTALAFERDRRRDLNLELNGWRVHRFDGSLIRHDPHNIIRIAAKLAGEAG